MGREEAGGGRKEGGRTEGERKSHADSIRQLGRSCQGKGHAAYRQVRVQGSPAFHAASARCPCLTHS